MTRWLDAMAEHLIGRGAMTAEQFYKSTPREIRWRAEGLVADDERAWQRTAQLASWVLQSLGSKVTANGLLGKPDNNWRGLLD